jgi:hypothetical protein
VKLVAAVPEGFLGQILKAAVVGEEDDLIAPAYLPQHPQGRASAVVVEADQVSSAIRVASMAPPAWSSSLFNSSRTRSSRSWPSPQPSDEAFQTSQRTTLVAAEVPAVVC